MTDQKIYPLNPIFETTTRDGRKAWVAFYRADHAWPWVGMDESGISIWRDDGRISGIEEKSIDLPSVPPIPPEAREPKPGEVWETSHGSPQLILEHVIKGGVCSMDMGLATGRIRTALLKHPWPADKPHGFEGLIEAILQAHGGKP